MDWSRQITRIRRKLRDPDANIWTNSQLLRLYNESQAELREFVDLLVSVQATPVPNKFQMSYTHDCEWPYNQNEQGYVYQIGYDYSQADYTVCFRWEMLNIAGSTVGTVDAGYVYTHPWEAFLYTGHKPAPVWCGNNVEQIEFIAYDKDPLDTTTLKTIQIDDPSWTTRSGETFAYRREDRQGDFLYLYPQPSIGTWPEESGSGMVMFDDGFTTISSEYGLLADATAYVDNSGFGMVVSMADIDESLLTVFQKRPRELTGGMDEESEYPTFVRKYIEYGVCERAYRMNTDGRIESLADYWGKRKQIAREALTKWASKRRTDRDYRLVTKSSPDMRIRRRPRLPDAYPDRW